MDSYRPDAAVLRQSVAQQQEQIGRQLAGLRDLIEQRDAAPADVAQKLTAFGTALQEHFRSESRSGLFDAVIRQADWAADRVTATKDQHGELLEQLHHVAQYASQCSGTEPQRQQLAWQFQRFHDSLKQHEDREFQLIDQVLTK